MNSRFALSSPGYALQMPVYYVLIECPRVVMFSRVPQYVCCVGFAHASKSVEDRPSLMQDMQLAQTSAARCMQAQNSCRHDNGITLALEGHQRHERGQPS